MPRRSNEFQPAVDHVIRYSGRCGDNALAWMEADRAGKAEDCIRSAAGKTRPHEGPGRHFGYNALN
jgi:hypothetical protein